MVSEANIYGEVVSAELTLVSVCAVFQCVQSWMTKGYILPEGVVEYLLVAQCDSSAE